MAARINFRLEGMDRVKRGLERLGKVPQKHVTSSARAGMNISLKESRTNAPYDTGELKKGIIMTGERSRTRGKKVYRVVFDSKMNDVFQKKDSTGKIVAYYPVSQEYGFFAKDGRYIPGYRFISQSLTDNTSKIQEKIISRMEKKIEQELRRAGLR